jgi:hypothetical protein
MSNLHYENSAVLRLVSVTPVIAALFEPLALEGMPPEHGKCRVSVVIESERTDASWDRLRDGLQALSDARQIDLSQEHLDRLASTWELTIRTDPEPDVKTLVSSLSQTIWIASLGRAFSPFLTTWIRPKTHRSKTAFFFLALVLDDGHGLEGLTRSACWYSSKTSALSSGGAAEEIGPHFSYLWNSDQAIDLAQEISKDLAEDRGQEATHHLCQHVKTLMQGFHMPQHRALMNGALQTLLQAEGTSYFAIWGRLPHDDNAEDSLELIEAISQTEAERAFSDSLWAAKHMDEHTRAQSRGDVKQEYGVDVCEAHSALVSTNKFCVTVAAPEPHSMGFFFRPFETLTTRGRGAEQVANTYPICHNGRATFS